MSALVFLIAAAISSKNVAVVAYEGAEILDFAGPAEVMQAASSFADDAFRVYTVGRAKNPVTMQKFIKITPEYSIEDAPKPDIVIIPGGASSVLVDDAAMLAWLKKATSEAEVTLTVCTGAFALAATGALDNLEITTWYGAIGELQKRAAKSRVTPGRRFIDNGKYITTAGVSAGIDGALHLVARRLGRRVADQTAQYMEYRWTPEPHLAVEYSYFNPTADARGRMLQSARLDVDEKRAGAAIDALRKWTAAHPNDGGAWLALGDAAAAAGKLEDSAAAFLRVEVSSPQFPAASYNAACMLARSGKKNEALAALRKSFAAGFDASYALRDPDLESIRDDVRKLAKP